MYGTIRSKLTYANVMSTIAVFMVLGGGAAFAVSRINGHELKHRSVPGHKLQKGAISQKELGSGLSVDHATSADQANVANHAAVANRVAKLHVTSAASSKAKRAATGGTGSLLQMSVGDTVTLYDIPPFTFMAHCSDQGGGVYRVSESVTSTADTWYTGFSNDPKAAGDTVALYDESSANSDSVLFVPTFVADNNGSSLSVSGPTLGVHFAGSDCAINQYAIG